MPSVVDDDGQTALHHAAAEGHTDAVLILAPDQTCAELFVCDKYEMTPFHLACENGHSESVAHLLAQLEQTEDEERVKRVEQMRRGSALFLAQQGGHTSIVGMMNGSTPNLGRRGCSQRGGEYGGGAGGGAGGAATTSSS